MKIPLQFTRFFSTMNFDDYYLLLSCFCGVAMVTMHLSMSVGGVEKREALLKWAVN